MKRSEIEYWALEIVSIVISGRHVEDIRVELKGDWPEPQRAARRLAGHSNAARGDNVLWLIGLDENRGVVGADVPELSEWWQATSRHFLGPIPIVEEVVLSYDDKSIVALLVETGSGPFVVKNPMFGSPSGGPVESEVPWREMTRTRSARHEDLIRLLVPKARMPLIEVLKAKLIAGRRNEFGEVKSRESDEAFAWFAAFQIYVVPHGRKPLVFPAHNVKIELRTDEGGERRDLQFYRVRGHGSDRIRDEAADLVADGPSRLDFEAVADQSDAEAAGAPDRLDVHLRLAGAEEKIIIRCEMKETERNVWAFDHASIELAS